MFKSKYRFSKWWLLKQKNKGLRKDSEKRIKFSKNYYKNQVKLNKYHKKLANKRNNRGTILTNGDKSRNNPERVSYPSRA